MSDKYWQSKSLFEMDRLEWESICDGCGKCCLMQLEDEKSKELVFTDIACSLLDTKSCRCTDYENRSERVPTCMTMTPDNVEDCAEFAPSSCAYKLLLEQKPLPEWHHLNCGDRQQIHQRDKSVAGKVQQFDDLESIDVEDHVVEWPEQI